ncbi:MAG TPA: ROK family protein [Cyanobacteria bacterium UBA8530]|nr:ROK family protein [Cyanobacteria bacterium UBA8530]
MSKATAPLTVIFPERLIECGGYALGIDVGGTKMLAGLVTSDGDVLHTWRQETSRKDVLNGILNFLDDVLASLEPLEKEMLVGIGVSTAGRVNWHSGVVEYATPNLPGWSGTHVKEILIRSFRLPVCVDNDGNAAAYGEYWCGSGQSVPNLAVLTLGTGVGGGIVLGGQVIRGSRGGGGELGHLVIEKDGRPCNCGQRGCLEAYASGTALAARAKECGIWENPTSYTVFEAAEKGHQIAQRLIEELCEGLALGILNIINFTDPDLILLGGGLSSTGESWLPLLRQKVGEHLGEKSKNLEGKKFWNPETVQLAQLGEQAGMIGAAGEVLARFGFSGFQNI